MVDKGTEALRNTFDAIHPPASLPVVLNANKTSLLKLKPRVINHSQWDLLYPKSGNPPDSKTFDVTLLTVLFRNICGFPKTGWGVMPVDTDRSMQANIVRIKSYRNEVYGHVTSTQVDNATFESLWQKITQTLVELNIPQNDVDALKISPLAPEEETYFAILKDWKLQEEECIALEEEVLKKLEGIGRSIAHLTQVTEENRDEIKHLTALQGKDKKEHPESSKRHLPQVSGDTSPDTKRCRHDDESRLKKLAKFHFMTKISRKVEFYLPETRKWLLKKVDDWFLGHEHESRIFLLKAGPGFGKSVFAAKVCEDFKKKGKLAACHFCDFNDSNLKKPMLMLLSLASQMCENVNGFKEKLLDQLKRSLEVRSLKDAFGVYLQNPLDELKVEEPFLIVIDALDESAAEDKNEIVNLITNYFPDLPNSIKVLVTSRPEISLTALISIPEISIGIKNANNRSDLETYLKYCLPGIAKNNQATHTGVLEQLVSMCEGSFLYAFHVQCELQKKRDDLNKMTLQEIVNIVPKSLDSIYRTYFQRLEDELETVQRQNINVMKLLELLVAVKGRLPLAFVSRALGLAPDCRQTKTIIKRINVAVSCLLYVSDDLVSVFHKSVIDWLLAKGYQDHEFAVKISNGDKLLWRICENVFEEIKKMVCSRHQFVFTNDVKYALKHGFHHLLACDMKESLYWLVDVVIIHVLLSKDAEEPDYVLNEPTVLDKWRHALRFGATISEELRARISWHIVELESMSEVLVPFPKLMAFYYLEIILAHSPKDYFSSEERNIAKFLLSKTAVFVEPSYDEVKIMPRAIWCNSLGSIEAAGTSNDKTMAAVAQTDGTIYVICVPSLVELWQYSCKYSVSCCTFSPDDSLVLLGKLETALSIVEKKEVPFFHGNQETFKSCAFSPNGKRLVTSDGSKTIRLWDVGKQSLLSSLHAKVSVNWCSFNSTGLFIIGNEKNSACSPKKNLENDRVVEDEEDLDFQDEELNEEDSFCVWNAVTLQRCDIRTLLERKAFQSETCKRCFRTGVKIPLNFNTSEVGPYISFESTQIQDITWCTGIYNGVECIFALFEETVSVIENTHFTTLAVWNFTCGSDMVNYLYIGMTAIEDDALLYANTSKLIVLRTLQPVCSTRVLSCSFSPDSSRLATCISNGCINIWNVHTKKVEQHWKYGEGKSPFTCWWSEKFFFVFDFVDWIPRLSKYLVDVNVKIMLRQRQQVPLCHLVEDIIFLPPVHFSEGFLCFDCGVTEPVKIVDVNGDDGPQIITLPSIEPAMSVTVSPGAAFVLGMEFPFVIRDKPKYYIWKKNTEKPVVYELFCVQQSMLTRLFGLNIMWMSCFTNDSKSVVILGKARAPLPGQFEIIDVNTGCHKELFCPLCAVNCKLFCLNNDRVVIVVGDHCIAFFDMDSGVNLWCSFQRFFYQGFAKSN